MYCRAHKTATLTPIQHTVLNFEVTVSVTEQIVVMGFVYAVGQRRVGFKCAILYYKAEKAQYMKNSILTMTVCWRQEDARQRQTS